MNIIHTENLTKTFVRPVREDGLKGSLKSLFHRKTEEKTALQSVNLTIEKGELVGLIGPNGAGKTTLVKLLTGIIQPTSGSATVMGFNPGEHQDAFKRQFAVVMGQKSQLWWDLPAIDTFTLNREIYAMEKELWQKNLDTYIELFGLSGMLQVPVRNLSLGERMKMELVASLLHNPQLLFLDEPTIGLDAIAQKQIRGFLKEVNAIRQVTILITSHYMEDIRSLCQRTLVINNGEMLYDGDLETLLSRYQERRTITVTLASEAADIELPDAVWIEKSPYRLVLSIPRHTSKSALSHLLATCDVEDIRIEEEDVSNVIERIYRQKEGIQHEHFA